MLKWLKAADMLAGRMLRLIAGGCLGIIFVLLTANVFVRFVPVVSLAWLDEIIEMLTAWMVFIGAAALWREKEHFAVSFLPDWWRGTRKGCLLNIMVDLISLTFLFVFTYYSLNLTIRASDWTPVLNMPKRVLYACMPISGAVMGIYSIRDLARNVYGLICGRKGEYAA